MFDEFYAAYPQVVIRPDGTKSFLRANVNNCRKKYNSIVGKKQSNSPTFNGMFKISIK